jgi:hypothetical protein
MILILEDINIQETDEIPALDNLDDLSI